MHRLTTRTSGLPLVLAVLATPQSGETTRDLVFAKAGGMLPESMLARGRTILDAARSRIEGAVTEGRDAAERQRADLEEKT